MRIVSWNCNMAFARKCEQIFELEPDILVLQECSEQDAQESNATSALWTGANPHRGLAVLTFGELEATPAASSVASELPWFLPVCIGELRLLAVWACVIDNRRRYVRLIHEALPSFESFLQSGVPIVAGDLNSNSVFDKKYGKMGHTQLVSRLAEFGLTSAYHDEFEESQGDELTPTFYLYRHLDRPFHLDYVFLPTNKATRTGMFVGDTTTWLALSDHLPVVADFDLIA